MEDQASCLSRTDPNSPLEQLRKIVEPPTPKTLNAQIEALSKKKTTVKYLVSQLKLYVFTRVRPYADYKTLLENYP